MNPQSTLELLSEVYVKLDAGAAALFGKKNKPLLLISIGTDSVDNPCPIPKAFQNLNEARLHLEVLTSAVYATREQLMQFAESELRASRDMSALDEKQIECLVSANSRLTDLIKNPQLLRHIESIERSVAAWSSALAGIPTSTTQREQQAWLLLEIRFFELWLTSSTWLDRYECLSDRFDNNYSYMLGRIERYLKHAVPIADQLEGPDARGLQHGFVLGHGLLLPLLGIAARCRNTHVRRRALLMSSRLHIQDGVLDSDFLTAILMRIVDMEEDTARRMHNYPPERPLIAQDVPEAARFLHATVSTREGQEGIARVVCCYWAEPADKELTLKEHDFALSIPEGAFPQGEPA